MSDSKSLVPTDSSQRLTERAGTAWRIIKGDRYADPLYAELRSNQIDFLHIDSTVRPVVEDGVGSTVALVKNLAEQYKSSQTSLKQKSAAYDILATENTDLKQQINKLNKKLSYIASTLILMLEKLKVNGQEPNDK